MTEAFDEEIVECLQRLVELLCEIGFPTSGNTTIATIATPSGTWPRGHHWAALPSNPIEFDGIEIGAALSSRHPYSIRKQSQALPDIVLTRNTDDPIRSGRLRAKPTCPPLRL